MSYFKHPDEISVMEICLGVYYGLYGADLTGSKIIRLIIKLDSESG